MTISSCRAPRRLRSSAHLQLGAEVLRAASPAYHSAGGQRVVADALAAAASVVCGAAATARVLPMTVRQVLTGVRFRMGAATAVLRSGAPGLMDGAHPLDAVVRGRTAARAAAALAAGARNAADHTPTPESADEMVLAIARAGVETMARQLVALSAPGATGSRVGDHQLVRALHLLDHAVVAPAHPGAPADEAARVATVASAVSVSTRSLERRFLQHLGFSPRTYQRQRRVGAIARALEAGGTVNRLRVPAPSLARSSSTLSSLAHALGYTDHAHMTREFTRVMGVSPSHYYREALGAPVIHHGREVAVERSTPIGVVGAAGGEGTGLRSAS